MDRQEHIEGLRLGQLNPADIEYFFRSLADRVPRRVTDERAAQLQVLRDRIRALASDLGSPTAARLSPDDVVGSCTAVVAQINRMRRRHWRGKIDGQRRIDFVRAAVGEISADLRELTS